jgi:hypothetical protein
MKKIILLVVAAAFSFSHPQKLQTPCEAASRLGGVS